MTYDGLPLGDFEEFCDLAREQNEWVPPEHRHADPHPGGGGDPAGAPGFDFNHRGTWEETGLFDAGWAWVRRLDGDRGTVRRPGKDGGQSGTLGLVTSQKHGWPLFWNFSSSAADFESEHGYSRFSVFALLRHGGDFSAAARALREMGYGTPSGPDPNVVFGRAAPPIAETPDDGVEPDHDYATNDDLKRLNLSTKWVWEGWLQFGVVNLLAAEAGLGKTRFMADLCRRVSLGLPWPDGTPTPAWEPGRRVAMWVAADRNFGELVELSEGFGFGERICYSGSKADPTSGITLRSLPDFMALYRKAKAARPLFLVVDTAGGATPANLSRQEEARDFFAPLSDIAVKLHLCLVVITHLNSAKGVLGRRAEDRVRVVTRMTAADKRPETKRRLEVIKSNSLFPEPLGMTLTGTGSDYDDDPPPAPEPGYPGQPDASDSDPDRGPPTRVRACMDWLKDALSASPQKVTSLITDAKKRGFDKKLLYRTKNAMHVIETEIQGYKWWGLKKEATNSD